VVVVVQEQKAKMPNLLDQIAPDVINAVVKAEPAVLLVLNTTGPVVEVVPAGARTADQVAKVVAVADVEILVGLAELMQSIMVKPVQTVLQLPAE
jgi:hypothetical protein